MWNCLHLLKFSCSDQQGAVGDDLYGAVGICYSCFIVHKTENRSKWFCGEWPCQHISQIFYTRKKNKLHSICALVFQCSDMDFDWNFMVFSCFLFYFSDTIFALVGCHLLCVWSDRYLGAVAGCFAWRYLGALAGCFAWRFEIIV